MVLNIPFILQAVLKDYTLPLNGDHGVAHWARVFENGLRLAEETRANIDVVSLFAVLHDSRRINEFTDPDHGPRAAEFAVKLRGSVLDLIPAVSARLVGSRRPPESTFKDRPTHPQPRGTAMTHCLLRALMIAGIVSTGTVAFCDDHPGNQKSAQLNTTVKVQMSYLLYLPKDYEKQESWPLLLFLHGSGERGDDLELVKIHGPPKLIAAGKDFPFIVVSPQCPKERRWEPMELVALLDDLGSKYQVDADRIYVTGLSMGGFGTWQLASFAPNRLAAIAPICGGGEKYWARQFAHLPVWAFHGAKDTGVPLERSQVMVDELKKNGGKPKLTIYPEAGHDSWTETYDNPELYTWLLEQKRSTKD